MTVLYSCLGAGMLFYQTMIILCITFKSRKRQPTKKYIYIMILGFVAVCANAVFLELTHLVLIWNMCYIVTYCIITLVLCKLLFRCTINEIIFIYFVTQSYIDNCFILTKFTQSIWLQNYFSSNGSFYLSYVIVALAGLPVLFFFLKYKMIPLIESTENMTFWRYIWAIPVSFYLVYRVGISQQYVYLDTIWEQAQIFVPLFWTIATGLSFLMIVSMPLEVVRHVQYKEKLEALNQLLLVQKYHFHKLNASMEETRQIRHDLKHHMMALAGYAEKGEYSELKEYLKQYMNNSAKEKYTPLCSNAAVDSILHHYLEQAEQAEIKFTVKSETLKSLPCHESDLCVVLGNLLENAMDACFRQTDSERFINVIISARNQNTIALIITNSFGTDIRRSGDEFLSSKRNYASIGLGIPSIEKITNKCHGTVSFEYSDYVFTAKVLMMSTCPSAIK